MNMNSVLGQKYLPKQHKSYYKSYYTIKCLILLQTIKYRKGEGRLLYMAMPTACGGNLSG